MQKRRLFLLFLSAMTVSIIIMVIIYGLFIKDIDFTFNVKNPESAPSPIDAFRAEEDAVYDDASEQPPAAVTTPDDAQKKAEESTEPNNDLTVPTPEEAITEVVPLEPQVGGAARDEEPETAPTPPSPESMDASPSSLHFVYLDGFSSKDSAERAIQQLQERNLVAKPYVRQHKGRIILQFGVFSDRANAEVMAQQLRNQNVYVKVD